MATRKEREELKNKISYHNSMTKKLGGSVRNFAIMFVFFAYIAIWGFTSLHDNFMTFAEGARFVLKWIGLIGAIIFGVLTILYFISFRNSKKYTLELIDELDGKHKTQEEKDRLKMKKNREKQAAKAAKEAKQEEASVTE